jgi:hypothetical protein
VALPSSRPSPAGQLISRYRHQRSVMPLLYLAALTTFLRDGTIGYYISMPRPDNCWAAACATLLQIPLVELLTFA